MEKYIYIQDPLDSYPLTKSRQGALFQRNPVCALCFRVCKELCDKYGAICFDLLRSMQAADSLCAYFVEHAWEPPDVEQCRQWLENHLNKEAEVMVACAILSLSTSAMIDAPEPLRSRGQDIRCLIYGEAGRLYSLFRDEVWREHLCFSAGNYGPCPALPAELRDKKIIIHKPYQQTKRMEPTQNIQINGDVYQGCTFNNTSTTNNFYAPAPAAPKPECSDAQQDIAETDSLFCRITQDAYDKGMAQQVENELRSACKSAPKLIKAIKTNEALGYLDTKNLSSKELYDLLNEHFGLSFESRNFRYYRSK